VNGTLGKSFAAVSAIVLFGFCELEARSECLKPISHHEAVNIANRAVAKAGFDLNDLDQTATRDTQEWTEHVRMSIGGKAGEKAKQEAEQMDSVLKSHANFFSISYEPKKRLDRHTRLGGVSVLLDADTGEILIIQPAHRKAIYPGKASKKTDVSCPPDRR
jgi:hypothetical protein